MSMLDPDQPILVATGRRRCVNCSLLIPRNHREHSLQRVSTTMNTILQSWITPTEISSESVLCTECIILLQDRTNTFDERSALPLPVFGHRSVCFSCGISTLRASRTYTVRSDRQERKIILRTVPQHLVSRLERVCGACWMAAYREVRCQNQNDTNCPTLPDVGTTCFTPPLAGYTWQPIPTVKRAEHQSGSDCYSNLSAAHGSTQNAAPDPDTSDSDSLISEPSIHVEDQHHNIICNECKGQIIGFRYVCVQCADFDMCSACETRAAHSQHYVLRLPGPRPQEKVKSLITAIQEQLKTFFDTAINMDPLIEEFKMEYDIKEEPTDVDDDSIVPQQSELIEISIKPEEKITQQTITNMEHNLEQAISSILPDEQRSPTTIQQKDILEQAASSILLDEQETPINIKEESPHLTTSLVPEVNPSPSHSDSQSQQSSSHTYVYSTHKPAVKKKRYN